MTINSLKKIIKYRLLYSGTKETDILYKNNFLKIVDKLSKNDLTLIKELLDNYSDNEIYLFFMKKKKPIDKFKKLFKKIKNN